MNTNVLGSYISTTPEVSKKLGLGNKLPSSLFPDLFDTEESLVCYLINDSILFLD